MEGVKRDRVHTYREERVRIRGLVYLKGKWESKEEFVNHSESTPGANDYLYVKFLGSSANVVLGKGFGNNYTVKVELDGHPLSQEHKGRDVIVQHGESYVEVQQFKMYELVKNASYGEHELKLISDSKEVAAYAFTFGG